jgi:hypothetical protein
MSILSAIFVVGNVDLYLLERVLPLLFGIADFIKLLRVGPTHACVMPWHAVGPHQAPALPRGTSQTAKPPYVVEGCRTHAEPRCCPDRRYYGSAFDR